MPKRIKHSSNYSTLSLNTLDEYIQDTTIGYISENIKNGNLKTVTPEQLQKYLASPDRYYAEISDLIKYEYITNGDIYQLHILMTAMSALNYKINIIDYTKKNTEKNQSIISKTLQSIKYKTLTRDIISQLCSEGTIVTIWLGNKQNPYLYIFNDLRYVFPMYRLGGEWLCAVDMEWLGKMNDKEREETFKTLSPYITESDFNKFKNDPKENKYVYLPQDRTKCIRINTMARNQRLGLPMGTQALFDLIHKETLKNLEKAIANKIINNIAVLTIGDKENPNEKIPPAIKKKIIAGVKKALADSAKNLISNIVLPEYANIEWTEPKGLEGLDKEKFESINTDISTDIGISPALTNGIGGNSATAKFNLEMIYRRISLMLEDIDDIFNQLLTIILGKTQAGNIYFEFDKNKPIDADKVLDTLLKLHSEGFSLKTVVDMLPNIQFDNYINESIHEHETLDLYSKIKPPATSFTKSKDDGSAGASEIDETQTESDETIASKDYDKNGNK